MKKAIILLHGFVSHYHDFDAIKDMLISGYDCVEWYEAPGHTLPADYSKFTADATVDNLLTCYDKLASQYEQIDVMGYSMGGALASMLACQRKVNRVVLIAPANKYTNILFPLRNLAYIIKVKWDNLLASKGHLLTAKQLSDRQLKKYRQDVKDSLSFTKCTMAPNMNTHTLGQFNALMNRCNDCLTANDTPVLIIYGKLDELVPYASVEYLCKYFTNHQIIVYEDMGHYSIRGANQDRMRQDIAKFFAINMSNAKENGC